MNNLTKLSFSLGDDEKIKFNGMTPYQYTDKEVKIKSITANGNPLTPDKDKNVDIPVATTKTEWGSVYDEDWGEEIYTQIEVAGDAGLMSGEEKLKLKNIEAKAQVNKIESISANGAQLEIDENKNVDIPSAYSKEPEGSVGFGEREYFGGLMSAEDKKTVDTIPTVYSPLPTRDGLTHAPNVVVTLQHNKIIPDCTCNYLDLNIANYIVIGDVLKGNDLRLFLSEIVWKTLSTVQPNLSFPSNWVFVGNIDIEDNIFVPQMNMVYDIVVEGKGTEINDDFEVVVRVSGYEVS